MTYYNLYSDSGLLNSKPLSPEEVVKIMENEHVWKKNRYNQQMTKISTKDIRVVKTIIV